MLKLAIFDLANVFFVAHFDRAYAAWAQAAGDDDARLARTWAMDDVFARFERGEITPEQYYEHFRRLMDIDISFDQFVEGWCTIFGDVAMEVVDAMQRLQRSMPVVALTNTNIIHQAVWRRQYAEALQHFDAVYASHEIGLRKPEPQSFTHVLAQHDTTATETIFFDDTHINVVAAWELGIHSVLVTEPASVPEALDELQI
jgi:putative hydrolase of the HAD superfamily